jgi:hypothetical protein
MAFDRRGSAAARESRLSAPGGAHAAASQRRGLSPPSRWPPGVSRNENAARLAYWGARDAVEALVRRAEEIRRDNLHTLTVRT